MTSVISGRDAVTPVHQAFEMLLDLARRQQAIVEAGRLSELGPLLLEWETLVEALPEATPDERELLEAIEIIVWSTVAVLDKALHETAEVMSLVRRGRKAIGSYAGATAPAAVNTRG